MIAPDLARLVRPIDSVREDTRNARTHDDRNVAAIAESLATFGQRKPIIALPDGTVIAGNGTLRAARMLGWDSIAVATFEDEGKARAYALADNRTAELAKWDETVLAQTLEEMSEDLRKAVGFSGGEVDRLLATLRGDAEEQEIPEPPADPVTKPGDLWFLGKHRLVCGDSTVAADVTKALGGETPFLMVTDPPYGVKYDPEWRDDALGASNRAVGKVQNDNHADWREAWALFPGDVAYVWHADVASPLVAESIDACGFERRALVCWAKSRLVIGRGHYHHQHEPCWYAVRKGATSKWVGDRKQTTLWQIDKPQKSETGHSTQKPIECMARPMRNHGERGDHVYDPFLGSGTSVIAAEREGRICHGLELDPGYCDVIVQRWETMTGGKAKRG